MSREEVNRLILEKLQSANIDGALKHFLEEILSLERTYWNQAGVRYAKDYEDLIVKFAEERRE